MKAAQNRPRVSRNSRARGQERLGPVGASTCSPALTGATGPVGAQIQTRQLVGGAGPSVPGDRHGPGAHSQRPPKQPCVSCSDGTFLGLGFPAVRGVLVAAQAAARLWGARRGPSLGTGGLRTALAGSQLLPGLGTGRRLVGTGQRLRWGAQPGPGTSHPWEEVRDEDSLWMAFTRRGPRGCIWPGHVLL